MVIMLMVMIPAMRAEDFSAKDVVLEHIKDSHDWHITDIKTSDGELEPVAIPKGTHQDSRPKRLFDGSAKGS